jgi:glycosyltransferase involved in cell wall biosynthesis
VSVIIPTLNCREKLRRHLKQSSGWLGRVAEIIAIDSFSGDGTWELLNAGLSGYPANLLQRERGLYKSWNHAVSLATQPYVYFSTIGDIISLGGLDLLVRTAEQHGLEVVISPPHIVDENQEEVGVKWPIHRLLEAITTHCDVIIPTEQEREMLSCHFMPESIIGSSASNVYKSRVLKERPFPEKVGHAADVYWTIKNLKEIKIGIIKENAATFCWDGLRFTSNNHTLEQHGAMLDYLRGHTDGGLASAIAVALHENINQIYRSLVDFEEVEKSLRPILGIKRAWRHPHKVAKEAFLAVREKVSSRNTPAERETSS